MKKEDLTEPYFNGRIVIYTLPRPLSLPSQGHPVVFVLHGAYRQVWYNRPNRNMNKIASSKFTVSVKVATKRRLETLAKIAGRSSEFLAAEAISEYLDLNEAQVTGIKTAMGSLDRGAAIQQSSVREWVLSWGAQDEQAVPRPSTV